MRTPADPVQQQVLEIVARHLPADRRAESLSPDLALGAQGLGIDSVTTVEILLACEAHFDMPFPPSIFDAGPLTIGRLVAHVNSTMAARDAR